MELPSPRECAVFIDFDGTMTTADVLDDLIRRYAPAACWVEAETLWAAGRIGSYECLMREISAIRISSSEWKSFIAGVQLDDALATLLQLLRKYRVPVAVLSDGIESIITGVLSRQGIESVAVRANRVSHVGQSLVLECPWRASDCASGSAHCKCRSARELNRGRKMIYIGDGRSDLCAALKADICFAKSALSRLLNERRKPFIPFNQLSDVLGVLESSWLTSSMVLH